MHPPKTPKRGVGRTSSPLSPPKEELKKADSNGQMKCYLIMPGKEMPSCRAPTRISQKKPGLKSPPSPISPTKGELGNRTASPLSPLKGELKKQLLCHPELLLFGSQKSSLKMTKYKASKFETSFSPKTKLLPACKPACISFPAI